MNQPIQPALEICAKFEIMWRTLRQNNITQVIVEFDGSGDTGDIEDVRYHHNAAGLAALADDSEEYIRLTAPNTGIAKHDFSGAPTGETYDFGELVRHLAHHILDDRDAPDWVNNEGGYGAINFILTEPPTINVEYNIRIINTEFSEFSYDQFGIAVDAEATAITPE